MVPGTATTEHVAAAVDVAEQRHPARVCRMEAASFVLVSDAGPKGVYH